MNRVVINCMLIMPKVRRQGSEEGIGWKRKGGGGGGGGVHVVTKK